MKRRFSLPSQITCASALPDKTGKRENRIFSLKCYISALPEFNQSLLYFFSLFDSWLIITLLCDSINLVINAFSSGCWGIVVHTKVHTKRSGMDHTVLRANNTMPAFPSWRSPDVTTTATEAADIQLQLTTHLSTQKYERLSWPSWLSYSGWLTHIIGQPSATTRAQDSESTSAKDQCSTAGPRNQQGEDVHAPFLPLGTWRQRCMSQHLVACPEYPIIACVLP